MSALFLHVSGWFLLRGGLLLAVTVFHLPISPSVTALITLLGGVRLLLGLPALYERQAKQVGGVGLVGLVIIWLDMLIFPVLAGGICAGYLGHLFIKIGRTAENQWILNRIDCTFLPRALTRKLVQ